MQELNEKEIVNGLAKNLIYHVTAKIDKHKLLVLRNKWLLINSLIIKFYNTGTEKLPDRYTFIIKKYLHTFYKFIIPVQKLPAHILQNWYTSEI
jgi:hypothetical protein